MITITLTLPNDVPFVVDIEGLDMYPAKRDQPTNVFSHLWPFKVDWVRVKETPDEINELIRAALKEEAEERTARMAAYADLGKIAAETDGQKRRQIDCLEIMRKQEERDAEAF